MQEHVLQWENESALRKYPLADGSSGIDDLGRALPDDFIVDLSMTSFSTLRNLRLSGAYSGPSVVSVVFSDDSGPVAHATARKPEVGVVALEPDRDGVSGTVEFGNVDFTGSFRFSSFGQSGILPFCVLEFPECGVVEFVDDTSGEKAEGDVSFNFGRAVLVSIARDNETNVVTLTPSTSMAKSLSTGCVPTDLNTACIAPVIRTFNGVSPDEDGAIAIVLQ